MPIESGTVISDLDALWPLSGDFLLEGDNHLRLIKSVLKQQFPGSGGTGLSIPIIATEEELNYLSGVTSNIQDQIDAITADDSLIAPQGTVMVFYQTDPPTGWTQVTTEDDAMLRVVDGAGGIAGGTDSPILFDAVHTHTTASHSLTISEIPSHTHTQRSEAQDWDVGGIQNNRPYNSSSNRKDGAVDQCGETYSTGGGESHAHGDTGESGNTFEPKYISVIIASKD